MQNTAIAASFSLMFLATAALRLQDSQPAPDKSQYNLFNPTPASQMRDLSTDRPDVTEGPITVDAGHLQLEMDFINFTYDRHKASTDKSVSTTLLAAPFNLRLGLTNDIELGVIYEPYDWNRDRDRDTGAVDHQEGTGDTTFRLKVNLMGNDGGFALALFPFIKLPTNHIEGANHNVEGGLIIPVQFDLPWGFNFGAMTEFDALRDDDRNQYHAEFVNTATVHHLLVGKLDSYIEIASTISAKGADRWIGTADCGLLLPLTDNIQIDCGTNIGITKSAPDYQFFTGLSIRF